MENKKFSISWSSLFLTTFSIVYLFIINEWVFAITKPSYMNDIGFLHKIQILLTTAALLTSVCFLCLLPQALLSRIPRLKTYSGVLINLSAMLPAFIFAILILFLVDNFTYTIFKFGVVSTDRWSRGLYGVAFIIALIICYRYTLKVLERLNRQTLKWGLTPKRTFSLLTVILISSIVTLIPSPTQALPSVATDLGDTLRYPHILLITADGLNAENMSVYGYIRNTTPHLQQLAASSLVAENAFSNAGNSAGSVVSIYTSKYPTRTRVLYPPNRLKEADAYNHLPGILHSRGYRTVQITLPYYLDPNELNILDGFDEIKMSGAEHSKYLAKIYKALPGDKALFIDETMIRVVDRIRHIFFIKKMINPYSLVMGTPDQLVDLERVEYLKEEIKNNKQPVFIHIHLVVTHGEKFHPSEQYFSAGQSIEGQKSWNVDFYDDSIRDLDSNIGELVDFLKELGLLDSTILIIGSDHGQQWDQRKRLPLIMHFPHGQYAGRIQVNVQNLDIAPTLLNYLNVYQPDWMQGESLLNDALEQRSIIGVTQVNREWTPEGGFSINPEEVHEPFYQFSGLTLIRCRKWFSLDLSTKGWETGEIDGSTTGCQPNDEFTDLQAFNQIVEHLKENEFDVSSLDDSILAK